MSNLRLNTIEEAVALQARMKEKRRPAEKKAPVKKAVSVGRRGMDWEDLCNQMHDQYEAEERGSIFNIRNSWRYAERRTVANMPPTITAVTGDGRYLHRIKTPYDWTGHYTGHPIAFDGKQFSGDRLNLIDLFNEKKIHQLHNLLRFYRCGHGAATAGYMVLAAQIMQAYFLDARDAEALRQKGEPRTLTVRWLKENARFVIDPNARGLFDWGAVMFPEPKRKLGK